MKTLLHILLFGLLPLTVRAEVPICGIDWKSSMELEIPPCSFGSCVYESTGKLSKDCQGVIAVKALNVEPTPTLDCLNNTPEVLTQCKEQVGNALCTTDLDCCNKFPDTCE